MDLGYTIKDGNEASTQNQAKAMIFHSPSSVHEELKIEYLTEKGPLVLWKKLKERNEHRKSVKVTIQHYLKLPHNLNYVVKILLRKTC